MNAIQSESAYGDLLVICHSEAQVVFEYNWLVVIRECFSGALILTVNNVLWRISCWIWHSFRELYGYVSWSPLRDKAIGA